jgi:hypothetical protein
MSSYICTTLRGAMGGGGANTCWPLVQLCPLPLPQMFGVCCTNPVTVRPTQPPRPTQPSTESLEEQEEEKRPGAVPSPNPIPPNWPPPIPTHPPDHTIPPLPTHPPSPGWPGLPAITDPPTTTSTTTEASKPPSTALWPPQPWPPVATKPTAKPSPAPTTEGSALSDASCGAKNGNQEQERIVGGHNAELGEWPWMVSTWRYQFLDGSYQITRAHSDAL